MSNNYQYYISYNSDEETFKVWIFDPNSDELFKELTIKGDNYIGKGYHMIQVGGYLLQWSPYNDQDENYSFRLLEFNPNGDPVLGSYDKCSDLSDPGSCEWTNKSVKSGTWSKNTFFGSVSDFSNAGGANKGYQADTDLILISMDNFVLNWIPTPGRGTYTLFNFDHNDSNPLDDKYTPTGAWIDIEQGHELMHTNGYVIDWDRSTGDFRTCQFDAMNANPLSYPPIQSGNWGDQGIDEEHSLSPIGNYILDWNTQDDTYRLWKFDQHGDNPLKQVVKEGKVPSSWGAKTNLVPIETFIPVDESKADQPGTMDFMRSKIKHVVYYMIENRSLDHVCGWLYDQDASINVIGPQGPYRGVDPNFTNEWQDIQYPITQYNDGKLSKTLPNGDPFNLDLDQNDPYHNNSDVLRQMFYKNINDYYDKKEPDMGGFAWNNGTNEVMLGYSPEQLPTLNGLAENFAISDDWHCSMPGGTDVNRAFALTGNTLGQLDNFQNGDQYTQWSEYPHRPSVWKTLWSNGIEDFKIYNSVEWYDCKFTYNLFLKGQIPSIDNPFTVGNYAPQMNQFFDDVKYGTLPKFAFLEPKWVASNGSTSYHPGNDLIPGERALKDIFDAIQDSPNPEEILLVVTFDEHGGLPDHVKPPYAVKPYANDNIQGFEFDIMGVRIPTILANRYISKNTVFRSNTGTSYDATSILSTLLQWCGIPRSRWGMAERTYAAPSFENVLQEQQARTDRVHLKTPWDDTFPPTKDGEQTQVKGELGVHDLHKLLIPRMVTELTPGMHHGERKRLIENVLSTAKTQNQLISRMNAIQKEHAK